MKGRTPPTGRQTNDRPPLRVLVVDPSVNQRRAASLLEHVGMTVLTAADALEGMELLRSFRPDVVITELVLPMVSGLDFLRRCRAAEPSTKLLAVTVAANDWSSAAAFAAGADFVLLKPTQWAEVTRLILSMTRGITAQVEDFLRAHGAPTKWAGFHQCARCAALLSERRCDLLKEAYIQVAREENISPGSVSKNVERFLREILLHTDLGALIPAPPGGMPATKEFLLALVQAATFPL